MEDCFPTTPARLNQKPYQRPSKLGQLSESSFELIANFIPQLVWVADKDGSIYWYNQRWYDYTGTTFQEVSGWGWKRVHDPKYLPIVIERWKQAIASGEPFEMEFPLRRADGCFRMFITRVIAVRDCDDRIGRWIGTNTDIEESRRAEERLHRLYDSGLMGIYHWKADGSIVDCNQTFLDILGYSYEDLRAGTMNLSLMTPPEYVSQDKDMLGELQEAGVTKAVEKELFRKDGSRVYVEQGAARSECPSLEGISFILDITKRKNSEADLLNLNRSLAKSQAYLYAMTNGATEVAIIVTDPDGIITVFNPGAEQMLLYRADEVVGIATPVLFHTASECRDQSEILSRELGRPIDGFEVFAEPALWGSPAEREWTYIRKDRSTIWVHLSTSAIRDAEGNLIGFIKVATDITARKVLERELRDYNVLLEKRVEERTEKLQNALAEKTVLLKEVHHRVKNNLAVVASLLGMQADASMNDDAIRPLLDSQRRVHSMALIHEHLYGTRDLSRVVFDQYARTLVDELYTAFSTPERIKVSLRSEPIELAVNTAIPCGLILSEILSNAFKYAFPDQRPGEIIVAFARDASGCLILTVDDNGIGFPKDLDWSRGETLGLRIVQILSKQLGATLVLHNGSGTHFRLTLPKSEMAEALS